MNNPTADAIAQAFNERRDSIPKSRGSYDAYLASSLGLIEHRAMAIDAIRAEQAGGDGKWTPNRINAIADRVRTTGDTEAADLILLMLGAGVDAEQDLIDAQHPQRPDGGERWRKQTTFYDPADPDNPNKGNCAETAVASLLNVPVPPKFGQSGDVTEYWDEFDAFIESHGFHALAMEGEYHYPGMYLASGPSSRGTSHMVVMHDGELLHDPHPSNGGIQSVTRTYALVPFDPAIAMSEAAIASNVADGKLPQTKQPAPGAAAGLRDIALRNLRRMIELGSTDKELMLTNLKELS